MKVIIYTLAYDKRHDGTGTYVFATKAELEQCQRDIIEDSLQHEDEEEIKEIREALAENNVSEAWDLWETDLKPSLDTYQVDETELTLPGPDHSQHLLPPNGERGTKPLPVISKPGELQVDTGRRNTPGEGVWMDWYNDRLQLVINDRQCDEPALHVRFNPDGSVAEVLVRDDLRDKIETDDRNISDWQKERDDLK